MSASDYRKLYKTKRWKRLRQRQLDKSPMCQCPHCSNSTPLVANVVDHIEPHKGDRNKFHNPRNLQSMNNRCHDKYKQSQERGGHGFNVGSAETGEPLSAEHGWYD